MKFKKYIYVLLASIMFFTLACLDDTEAEKIKVVISSYHSDVVNGHEPNFGGYYVIDGSVVVFVDTDYIQKGTNDWLYEKELEDVEYLVVQVNKSNPAATVTITIYKDDRPIKEATSSSGGTLKLEYDSSSTTSSSGS
jgi:predicted PilT family ATPase